MSTVPCLLELQRAFTRSVLSGDDAAIAPWVVPNGLTPGERLRIYRNMVFNTQTEALRTSFPTVLRLVGEECFDGIAMRYIAGAPSTSGNLQEFGATFASFLSHQAELAALPYLADVAALDWARLCGYLAGDAEPVEPATLADLSEAVLARCLFVLHPSTGLVESRYPLYDIWQFCQEEGGTRLSLDVPPQAVLVWRGGPRIALQALAAEGACFMRTLLSGLPLGLALDAATEVDARFDLAAHLGLLLQHGLIVGFHVA
jgi:hypothetical protein